MTEQPNALKGIPLTIHPVKKTEQLPNKPRLNCKPEPSPYNAINKPEQPKPIGYPTKEQFEKLEPLLDGRITEQPNTELLIVKTIQGLMSAASRELTELNKMVSIPGHKVLIDQVLEDIDLTEKTTLFELQKAFLKTQSNTRKLVK